jgi:ribosome-associated protein YbcJ (S4-like RNA binding protein)
MFKNLVMIILVSIISSCSGNKNLTNPVTGKKTTPGLFSKDSSKGISLSDILNLQDKNNTGVSVNGFLWRASLEVLSVAPLISTDALGGTIITDWYINKNIEDQRIKITAFIKTSELRSDGIKVKVYIQNKEKENWSDTLTNQDLETKIENKILNEARILRINSLK